MHRGKIALFLTVLATLSQRAWSSTSPVRSSDWTWPPAIVISLVFVALLYARGRIEMSKKAAHSNYRAAAFFALGWISLLIALDSPIHEMGEQLFWVHMTQHEILMLVSAPLLVLGRPLLPFLYALPRSWRTRIGKYSRSRLFCTGWEFVSNPLSAWLFSALALWVWHIPWLFDLTLRSDWTHAAQHTSFLVSGLLFWWPLVNKMRTMGYGGGVAYVFTTGLHTSILGALLTFSQRPWYSSYEATAPVWGLTAIEDQQLGGLIMWIPAGTILLLVALFLLVRWMNDAQVRFDYTRMADLARLSDGGAK